jgi:hypothetical protein
MKKRIGPIDPPSLPLSFKTTTFSSSSPQYIYIYKRKKEKASADLFG